MPLLQCPAHGGGGGPPDRRGDPAPPCAVVGALGAQAAWPFLHPTPEVASAVLAIFLRVLRAALRDASPGVPAAVRDAQPGAISFPQRFGSSLNPHYHYHVLALDGVVSGDTERRVRFHEAAGLEARDAGALARTEQLRVLRWFTRRRLLDPATAADMRTWRGTSGSSVDGSVRIEGHDRAGLERLVRYCTRGPLTQNRLRSSRCCDDRLNPPNARPTPSGSGVLPPGSALPWGPSEMPTIMPWRSPSSPASSASSWIEGSAGARPRGGWRSSGTSRVVQPKAPALSPGLPLPRPLRGRAPSPAPAFAGAPGSLAHSFLRGRS